MPDIIPTTLHMLKSLTLS